MLKGTGKFLDYVGKDVSGMSCVVRLILFECIVLRKELFIVSVKSCVAKSLDL